MINSDGTPKVWYYGSQAKFTIFDRTKAKSSGLYGKGFYFSDQSNQAGVYGETYSVYLNIRNPLTPDGTTVSRDHVRSFIEAIAENEDYSIENYGTYDVDAILEGVMGQEQSIDAFKVIQDLNATAIGNMVEGVELFNQVNGTKFDGIVVPTETVAFYPEQIKSATDNIGTFDGADPDINHSFSPVEGTEEGAVTDADGVTDTAAVEDAAEPVVRRETLNTKARNYLRAAETKLRKDIAKALSVPYGRSLEYLRPVIQEISDEFFRTGTVSQEAMDSLFEKAYELGVVQDREFFDQYKPIKDHLRTTAVMLSEQDRADIAKAYRHMSKKVKAVLWQLLSGTKTAENNPYDVKTGEKVPKKYNKPRDDQKNDE